MSSAVTATLDLDSLASKYEGETKLQRLIFWSRHSALSEAQHQQCQTLALQHIQSTGGHYKLHETLISHLPSSSHDSAARHQQQQQEEQAQLAVLEARLSSAQAQLHKDSIRSAYLNLAQFQHSKGNLLEAFKKVLRSRDYCSTRTQTGHVCLLVIELSLDLHKWSQVREYVNKAQHASLDPSDEPKLPVAQGLAFMMEGNFSEASRAFAKVIQPPAQWRKAVAPEDVTAYACLLALSEFSRDELVDFLDSKSHLELQPRLHQALREFVVKANYKCCLDTIRGMYDLLDMDIYLHPHLEKLQQKIWHRSIVDYARPFCKLSVPTLCSTFGLNPSTDTQRLQLMLVELIGEGKLPHRLNVRAQTLEYEDDGDKSMAALQPTQTKLALLEEAVLNDVYSMIVRLACLENLSDRDQQVSAEASRVMGGGIRDVVMSDDDDDLVAIAAANPDDDMF